MSMQSKTAENHSRAEKPVDGQGLPAIFSGAGDVAERKALSDALRASEEKYRVLVETTGAGYLIVDTKGKVIDANSEYVRMTGHAHLGDILGRSVLDWTAAYHAEKYTLAVTQCVKDGFIRELALDYEAAGGRITPIEVNATVVGAGDDRKIIALCRDLTERNHIENLLSRSELRFRTFVENANDVLFAVNSAGVFSYISPQWTIAFGYEISDTLGQPFGPFVHPEDLQECMEVLQEVMQTGGKKSGVEYRVRCKDGAYKWYRANGSRVQDPKDGSFVFVGIGRDVSDSKKTEQRLQLARDIFDSAKEAIFVSDLCGNLLDVNAEACRLAKYSREDMLRLRNVDIIAPEEVSRIASVMNLADVGTVVESRWSLLCSDGSTVPLDLVVQRLAGDQYLALGRDVSERDRALHELADARDAAQAANLAKSRFLASASHDLRQPIQAIALFQHALQRTGLNEEQRHINDLLALSVQSLGDLLNALLDISRLDAGAVIPHFEAVGVENMLQAMDGEFWPLASAKSLSLRLAHSRGDMAVWADSKLLNSLLGNLVGNAIKYTESGSVLVSVRRRGTQGLIQVWDTGIGIAAEHKDAIYEEYLQINNSERDRTKGLGLGLAIVKRLARLLNTAVTFRSQPGRGSVFGFYLTLVDAPVTMVRSQRTGNDQKITTVQTRRVVLVEDDGMVSKALTLLLESLGMQVTDFACAMDALAYAQTREADFYLTDLRLPDLTGLEFLHRLEQCSSKPIKAVILTGDTSPDRIEVIQSSRWPVLFKPIELSALLSAIEEQDSVLPIQGE
jgi:PAS domain S-box-containing protein